LERRAVEGQKSRTSHKRPGSAGLPQKSASRRPQARIWGRGAPYWNVERSRSKNHGHPQVRSKKRIPQAAGAHLGAGRPILERRAVQEQTSRTSAGPQQKAHPAGRRRAFGGGAPHIGTYSGPGAKITDIRRSAAKSASRRPQARIWGRGAPYWNVERSKNQKRISWARSARAIPDKQILQQKQTNKTTP
jgi:hypothetical protein